MKKKLILFVLPFFLFVLISPILSKSNDSIVQKNTQTIAQSSDTSKISVKKVETVSIFQEFKNNTSFIKDIIYIVFLLTTSIVAILTYNRAKHTILQPLKSEVIKKQITIFSDLILFLEDSKNFNFYQIISLNVVSFINKFETHRAYIEYNQNLSNILSTYKGSFGLDISDRDILNEDVLDGDFHKLKFEKSGRFVVSEILLDNDDIHMQTIILNLIKNPLIPKKIRVSIEKAFNEYRESLRNVLPSILEVYLNEIYIMIQKNEPISESNIIEKSIIINNLYNRARIKHEISTEKIKLEINKYLKIENLI